jgi:SAM-dependent methyltransferase
MLFRESSMPEREAWETFFEVDQILDRFALVGDVAELGCGYGTFTLPLARRLQGTVHAIDIDPAMVATVRERAAREGIGNIETHVRDVSVEGFGLPAGSCHAALLFNILHCELPVKLMQEATRILRPAGLLAVIHWRSDIVTPRGPPSEIRPTASTVAGWALEAGNLVLCDGPFLLPPWHYGLKFARV